MECRCTVQFHSSLLGPVLVRMESSGATRAKPGSVSSQKSAETLVSFQSAAVLISLFFSGNPKSVVDGLPRLTGRPQFVPLFALGFHQCR
jgi:alpha-glucosidase (family GH31 glycosyl hydrolase)